MFDEDDLLDIFIDEMLTQLECPTPGCNHGEGGVAWKSQPLSEAVALEMWKAHRADAHGHQAAVGGAAHDGGGGRLQLAKIPRPVVCGGCSQEDFKYFTRSWNQYVRASNEKDGVKLRDQLLHCPDEALKKAVDRALGDRVENISLLDLLKEIESLAVVKQSNHVNTLALMTAKQEREEPVRQFAACLSWPRSSV
jgi:hypothetical protein